MHKSFAQFGLVSGLICTFLIFISYATEPVDEFAGDNNLPQMILAPDIGEQFNWAGEPVPFSADARERLDRELMVNSYYHSSTLQNIKLAHRYFPVIEPILREQGIPDDFKYLAVAESNLRHVSSYANAKGFWQFRKAAAKEQGLEVNDEVDERYHVEKSTRAACQYLHYLKKRFGTWTDASAAYNVGPTRYAKELKIQRQQSFYHLNLNQETSRYIYRLVAIKSIMSNPEKFGFYIAPEQLYPPLDDYREVIVDQSVENWGDFANENGITYRQLKRYNPWLRDDHLTVIKNTYRVKVPN